MFTETQIEPTLVFQTTWISKNFSCETRCWWRSPPRYSRNWAVSWNSLNEYEDIFPDLAFSVSLNRLLPTRRAFKVDRRGRKGNLHKQHYRNPSISLEGWVGSHSSYRRIANLWESSFTWERRKSLSSPIRLATDYLRTSRQSGSQLSRRYRNSLQADKPLLLEASTG